ncbi:MAG TPA: hypothetical protein VN456_05485 [Desulfosporosinus sp.]|nr:hypothetical protein [Desulfosporosinus sp.]
MTDNEKWQAVVGCAKISDGMCCRFRVFILFLKQSFNLSASEILRPSFFKAQSAYFFVQCALHLPVPK